jgi:hypothetical protein
VNGHNSRAGLCGTHRHYMMDCASFDALWKRARGCCEICDIPPERTPHGVLHIDHDEHVGRWGVRGLLCSRCNSSLHRTILDAKRVMAYLADPWWKHILEAHGVPADGIPEPGIGAVVRVGPNLAWQRTQRGWKQVTGLYLGWGRIDSWSVIATRYGPHRVRVVSGQLALV